MLTSITGVGDGSTPVVNITFPYLDKAHVKATVDGTEVAFTWSGTSQVTFSAAVPSGSTWSVSRETPVEVSLVDYTDGAVLVSSNLNTSQDQLLYLAQELTDKIAAVKLPDPGAGQLNVRALGAKGDGSDDSAALQAVLNNLKALGGGTIYFPAGHYVLPVGLIYDLSQVTDRFGSRIRLVGDGPGSTHIEYTGTGTALTLLGNPAVSETYLDIEGIRLTGTNAPGSRGIYMNVAAFGSIDRAVIEAFEQNVEFFNVEQMAVMNSTIRWGIHGLKTDVGTSTAANSLVLINTAISNNSATGIDASDLNLFTMVGGSIQYNGAAGAGDTNFGVKLTDPGSSYGPNAFIGVAFEGNGGAGDLWVTNDAHSSVIALTGVAFARATATNYGTNNLRLDGTAATKVSLTASGFRSFNAYTPSAARPYIAINNPSAVLSTDGTIVFGHMTDGSMVEAPSWASSTMPVTVSGGTVRQSVGAIVASFPWDPILLNDKESASTSFGVTGAEMGDPVLITFSTNIGLMLLQGEVLSSGQVGARLYNDTGGTLDVNGTVNIWVLKAA